MLSDGRTVVMRELNAMEMMAASRIATAKGQQDAMSAMAALACFCITTIDGAAFSRPTNLVGVQSFMATLRARDFARLQAAAMRLNSDDPEGEATAAAEP
jgi:hypothetical protein